MKTISRILVLVFGVLFFAGCTDLNTFPEGGTKTESQKQAAINNNPELLAADVSAIYATMIELFAGLGEANEYHSDFGYASLAIIMDANGQDVTCPSSGYNWFSRSFSYADRVYTSAECLMTWKVYYKIIRAANAVLGVAPADAEDDILKAYRGQALAARAFAYLNMAQLYQFKYKGNENKPCVPIVSENMTSEQQMKNPRATVQEVYDSIMSDLNEAVTLLNNYKRSEKSMIDQAVAYGLRARANLVQENWAEAAADAQEPLVNISTQHNKQTNTIIISICNNGKSFSKEMLKNAFEPYATDKPPATGLGLPVVKKIIEEHSGKISINNLEKNGACVTITLPVHQYI